jgi:pyocin large subunit-like protein
MDFFNKELYEQGLKFQKNMMDHYMDTVNTFTGHFTAGSEKKADDSKKK